MATKQATIGSAGSRNRFASPFSLGITMGANEYPSGTLSFDNIGPSNAYWYNASATIEHTETFYLCDSSGNNKIQLFTLTIEAGSSNSNIGKTATISAADGKKLKGKALYLIATNSSYPGNSYIGLANQTTITVNYALDSFAVTVNAGTGGTATTSAASAAPGSTITITCSPNTGYSANKPTASGVTFTSAGTNKWTFSMPNSNVTVSCTFSKISYTVTTANSPAAGGSLSANKSTANYGDEITLTPSASSGYQFSSYSSSPALTISSNKFTMPAQNVTVTANWSKISYNVTVSAGSGGSASRDKSTAQIGDTVTITCTPNSGYKANTPTATGITFTSAGTNKWSFTMLAAAVTVSCTFSKIRYNVTVSAGTGGSASSNKSTAQIGDTVTITCSPNTGYKANKPTASGITFTSSGTNTWTFTMPAAATTVSCTFTKIDYTVTVSAGTGGTATSSKAKANYGDTVTITCTPSTGYKANTPTCSGITFTSAGTNKWSFTMPAANKTISCTFTKINYTITTAASPAAGGSLAVSKNPANYGDNITCTPTANSGYQFSSYTTSPTVSVSSNKFVMPASAITVTAKFTKISYAVTVTAGTGGSAASSAATGQVGDTITITCTPSTGYKANKPTATGITFTSAGTNAWTFTMPVAAVSVSCTFSKVSYTVTVSAGSHGSATASNSSANYQDTITITASPDTGYKANTPTATGITFTADGTNKWKFTMPAAAVTVSITFSLVSYTITKQASPSAGGTVTTGANTATMGTEVTVSQTTATGYYFNGWTITPNTVTVSSGKFTMPASNVTIQANYLKRSTGTLSSSSMTGGGTVTLTIAPDKTTYSHKYKLSFGTGMETSNTTVAAGTTSVSISVPLNWSAQIPSATSKTGGILTLETYNGSTKIGTYTISNLRYNVPSSVVPSVGTITTSIIRTIGGTTYANVGSYYVQSKSGVRVQTTASGAQSSTIASIQVTLSGYTEAEYKKTVSAASVDWTSGLLTNSGTCTITVKATDSRGRTATKTKNITVTAYSKPAGTLNVWRVDENGNEDPLGTYGKYSKTSTYSAVGSNSMTVTLTARGTTDTNPANTGNLVPSSRKTFDQLSEYTISMTLVDAFETVTIQTKLPTAQFMIFCNTDGDRIGIMQATNTSRSNNGKSGTIELSGNHQIYIGDKQAEDYFGGLTVVNGQVCITYNT